MLMKLLISVLAIVALSVACGGGGSPAAPTTSSTPTAAQNPAPDALQATWTAVTNTTDASNVLVTLTLAATRYVVSSPGHSASGSLAVRGDVIEFFGSTACSGSGSYRWSLQGTALSFTGTGADQCGDRGTALSGITYTRRP
jgi:hypothetical protein